MHNLGGGLRDKCIIWEGVSGTSAFGRGSQGDWCIIWEGQGLVHNLGGVSGASVLGRGLPRCRDYYNSAAFGRGSGGLSRCRD